MFWGPKWRLSGHILKPRRARLFAPLHNPQCGTTLRSKGRVVDPFCGPWCTKIVSNLDENELSMTHHRLGHCNAPSDGWAMTMFWASKWTFFGQTLGPKWAGLCAPLHTPQHGTVGSKKTSNQPFSASVGCKNSFKSRRKAIVRDLGHHNAPSNGEAMFVFCSRKWTLSRNQTAPNCARLSATLHSPSCGTAWGGVRRKINHSSAPSLPKEFKISTKNKCSGMTIDWDIAMPQAMVRQCLCFAV